MEGQMIIRSVLNNPEILSVIPGEIFLLKFLRLTKNTDVRNFLLKTNDFSKLPVGFVSKILKVSNMNFIHLLNYHKNYFIINDYYDYVVDNDEIVEELNDMNMSTKDIRSLNRKLVNSSPDMIVVQHESAINKDLFANLMVSKKDIQDTLNLKMYNKHHFDNLNGNTYHLDLVITDDYKIYFKSNHKKEYVYSNGKLKETSWDGSSMNPLISIYHIDSSKLKVLGDLKSKSPEVKKASPPKIDLFAKLMKRAEEDKAKLI
jgi:hypothetical protein